MSGLSRQGKRVLWPGPRRTGRAVTEEGSGTDGSRPGLSRKYQMSGNQIQQDMSRNTQSRVGLRAVSGQSVTWGKVSPFALQTQGSGCAPDGPGCISLNSYLADIFVFATAFLSLWSIFGSAWRIVIQKK